MNHEEEKTQRPEDPETPSNEVTETQRPEDTETPSNEVTESQSHEVTEVAGGNAVESDELFNRLKGELMDEIRKYFEPLVKKSEAQVVQVTEPPGEEENLISQLLEETGWRNG